MYSELTDVHASAWYQRYSNYWRLRQVTFDRANYAAMVNDCYATEDLFIKAFKDEKTADGEPVHKFENVNHHTQAFHWIPNTLFNGPPIYTSTQPFEQYHQIIKSHAEESNQHDLFMDIMKAV